MLDRSGDIKLIWNAERQDEIDAAESMFDEMRCKGYLAYKVDDEGDQGEVIREFDPETERIIMSPPMQGG